MNIAAAAATSDTSVETKQSTDRPYDRPINRPTDRTIDSNDDDDDDTTDVESTNKRRSTTFRETRRGESMAAVCTTTVVPPQQSRRRYERDRFYYQWNDNNDNDGDDDDDDDKERHISLKRYGKEGRPLNCTIIPMRCAPFDEGRVRLMQTSLRTTYQPTTNRGPLAVHGVTKVTQGRLWENIYPYAFKRIGSVIKHSYYLTHIQN
ncbi:hypothetical protein V1478_012757 [Vespula squamosa]|uniref:Uncharacterized protein n=1 Tax=Vespula squamosa TaxID=30214 RepID=A0ABD2A908_VESSQ